MIYRSPKTVQRPGVVLLVVMAMLALFASVALSFVFYADNEATTAGYSRDAVVKNEPEVDADLLAAYFLNQLLYGTNNPYSALRGWDLATSIYGSNPSTLNFTTYAGIGRSAQSYPTAYGIDNFYLINYQKYEGSNAADPFLGNLRMPEYTQGPGIASTSWAGGVATVTTVAPHSFVVGQAVLVSNVTNPAYNGLYPITGVAATSFTYNLPSSTPLAASGSGTVSRYVGGANPPWTAYDTNNMFLAQVDSTGTVFMPSFARPWHKAASGFNALPQATQDIVGKYISLYPDAQVNRPTGTSWWNPRFVLPDVDASGMQVKNLDFGLGMNDSNWMDLGFPVLTAPNGKRYKALFAPLVMDMSNRINLWAHGNRLGDKGTSVSNLGYGLTEVNPMRLIDAATGGPIGAVPGSPKFNEILMLYNYRYGGKAGLTLPLFGAGAPAPVGVAQNFLPTPTVIPPPWYSYIDADGLGADPTGKLVGTYPALVGVGTTTSAGGVAVGATSITVAAFSGKSNSGFPWNIMPGVTVVIDTGANAEIVTVATANPASSSFTFSPPLALAHGAGTAVAIGGSYFGFPTFPTGWSNTAATLTGEITNAPLAFNLQKPTLPNIRSTPSQMEAVLRWGATNSPALTSDIFKLMPQCFSDPRFRNKVTTESWSFDRIHASPVIAFDPLNPPVTGNYTLVPPNLYPKLAAAKVTVPATSPSPSGYTAPGPDFTGTVPMAQNNDFIPTDWRSNLGMMLRLNLNRPLTNYPYPPAGGSTVISTAADIATYKVALADRQRFALDIYTALLRVTGAQDPNSLLPAKLATLLPTDPNYMAARWLAQLAVNMVDYIDNDDYVTSWNWNAGAIAGGATNLTSEFVFGTELPRLVLNEIYGQYDDDGMDPSIYSTPQSTKQAAPKASAFNLNVWAELHNPFFSTPAGAVFPYDGGTAMLQNAAGGFPVYRITVCWSNAALSALMRDPANNMGDPGVANTLFTCSDWGSVAGTQQVLPANGAFNSPLNKKAITTASEAGNTVTITTSAAHGFNVGQKVVIAGVANASYNGTYTIATVPSATTFTVNNLTAGLPADSAGGGFAYMGTNNGFYVIGPNATTTSNPLFMPPYDPYIPTTWSSPSMKKTFGITATPQPITVVLQRLAVPHLPPQPNPALALYNPYITVDYMDNIPINDGRVYDGAGVKAPAPNAVTAFTSFGRRQPYAAERTTQVVAQTGTVPPSLAQNSFFQHNVGATTPFDWLVHLDRAPINVTELRHVCAFKPHELTQQFINSAGVKFQHRAAWTDDTAMLYRLYDCFSSANHMAGNIVGGRIPGQININTIMPADGDVFQALCDSQDWNQPPPTFTPMFNSTDVGNIFAKVVGSRHLFGAVAPPINEGNPFRPYSAGSITQTMLRTDPGTGKQLFSVAPGVPNVHPYAHEALLQKIQNNVTTTSNVFAVWWTVGFFEVVDESVRPARLGPEIGRAQNRHIRHRFFALVDRSKMQLFKTTSTTAVTFNAALGMAPQTFTVTVNAPTGAANGVPIGLVPGMLLEIDRGTANAEVVAVTGVPSANSFTAAFTRSHAAGFTILCRGNPGTRAVYNPHDDTTVVLHMSTIK